MKSLLRLAAIAVASTALVAGGTTAATAAPGDTASVTGLVLQPTATRSESTFIPGTVTAGAPGASFFGLKANVTVNGVLVATAQPVYQNGIYYQRAWGAGIVSLSNFTASGFDSRAGSNGSYQDRVIPGPANSVQVRYAVDPRSSIKITKKGKKLTFRLKARYIDNTGAAIGLRKATIQVKKGGKWKTLKNVKLNRKGTATYKRSDGKKRNYRMLVKTTDLVEGGTTNGTRKL